MKKQTMIDYLSKRNISVFQTGNTWFVRQGENNAFAFHYCKSEVSALRKAMEMYIK